MASAPPHGAAGRAPERTRPRLRWLRARAEVAWLFLLALVVRLLAVALQPAILNDSVSLLRAGRAVREEGLSVLLGLPHHPLPPLVVSWFSGLGPTELVVSALCALAGAYAVWPLHVVARRACGRHAATMACLLYAVLPKAVEVASVPLAEAFYLPLFLGSLALAVSAGLPTPRRRRVVRLLGCGLLAGLAYLVRPEGLLTGSAAVAAAALLAPRGRRRGALLVSGAAFLLLVLPYVAALSQDRGRLALSPKKDVQRFAFVEAPAADPGIGLGSALRETASAVEGALTVPVILLVLAGAFPRRRWRHRHARWPRALLLVAAGALLALVVRLNVGWGYGGGRHALAGCILLLPFAGEGVLFLGAWLGKVVRRRRLAFVVVSALAIPLGVRALLRPAGEGGETERRLGETLSARAEPGRELVIATFARPRIAWYAERARAGGGRSRDLPLWGRHRRLLTDSSELAASRAELVRALRDAGAEWVVLDVYATEMRLGRERRPEADLAERLLEDGVLGLPAVAAGSELVAFPVLPR